MIANMIHEIGRRIALVAGALALTASGAYADSIAPTSFSANLGVGESVTIHKTITVDTAPSEAVIDLKFVFDTTGSMSSAITGAKSTATSLLNSLSALGNVHSGVGQYDDPGHTILNGLTSNVATSQASINTLFACYGSCGGDTPEVGFDGISDAANSAWRTGSNRFIVVFGDAPFVSRGAATLASTQAALATSGANLIALNFGGINNFGDITNLGGTLYSSGTSGSEIATNIINAITASFLDYSEVTVDDLGGGSPYIDVSVVCTDADSGTCVGDTATGDFDRSISRTFGFDVTFTRTAAGDVAFDTYGIVDGGIIAVPEPATLVLLAGGLLGIAGVRRRG